MADPTITDLLAGADDDVVVIDPATTWSRRDLFEAVERVAAGLRGAGVTSGDRVAVVLRASGRSVAALLGARAIGALVCPVDPDQRDVLGQLRATAIVGEAGDAGVLAIDELLRGERAPLAPAEDGTSAWGISTSGTTGRPKTAVLLQSGVAHITDACSQVVGYRTGDRIVSPLPFHHVYGLSQIWMSLRARATLLLPPWPLAPADMAAWSERATVLAMVPSTLRLFLARGGRPRVRLVTLSGQGTPPELRRTFVDALPETEFLQFYGLTEGFRVLWLSAEEFITRPDMTGRPCPGITASIDDQGELWIEGPNVAAGYLDDPERTAVRFPGGKLRTGDVFEKHGDLFRYVGRADGIFKSFGEKVVPEVIERVVLAHASIETCVVIPREQAGELRPVLLAVPRGTAPETSDLMAFLRTELPSAMVPVRIRLVESLPTTASGKVKRNDPSLKELL